MTVNRQEPSFMKKAAIQLAAGGSAGCIEVSIMHPLDLVKTRFQIQSNTTSINSERVQYNGLRDCFVKMYRTEGIKSFWKGVLPPIMVETPKRAWKFFTFEQFQGLFLFGRDKPNALTYSLAGLGSGVTEAIIVNPFEVVKVKLQSNQSHQSVTPSTGSVAREIIKTDGIFGANGLLGKGITATMGRNGFFNMIYFGFYHSTKDLIPASTDPKLELAGKILLGFTAGTLGSCFNIPFDVAKSRIQGPQQPGVPVYRGTAKVILRVYKEEGFMALYKGLLPKVLRLGPGGAIMLIIYEKMSKYLYQKFP